MLNPDPSIEGAENISLPKITLMSNGGLLRIGVPKDGSCLFHSILRSFNKDYNEGFEIDRYNMVKRMRIDLAKALSEKIVTDKFCPLNPTKTYYDVLSSGNLAEMGKTSFEYSLEGIQAKLLSMNSMGMELLEAISMFLKVDIYIIDLKKSDLYYMGKDVSNYYKYRESIVLAYIQNEAKNDGHYEVVGLNVNNFVYTIFKPDNDFIVALRRRHSEMSH